MKKHPLCALILLIILQTAQAQNPATPKAATHPWSLSLAAGPAFPTGGFNSLAPGPPIIGHTQTGRAGELSLGYSFNRYIGALFTIAGQVNSISPQNNSFYTITHYDQWKMARFLLGPSLSLPFAASRFSVQARAQAGVGRTGQRNYSYIFDTGDGPMPAYGKIVIGPSPWTFTYQAGAGLKWQSNSNLFLLFDATYMHINPGPALSSVQLMLGAGIRL